MCSHTESAIIIDNNNIPMEVANLKDFLDKAVTLYKTESEKYYAKHSNIKKQRIISNLTNLWLEVF